MSWLRVGPRAGKLGFSALNLDHSASQKHTAAVGEVRGRGVPSFPVAFSPRHALVWGIAY